MDKIQDEMNMFGHNKLQLAVKMTPTEVKLLGAFPNWNLSFLINLIAGLFAHPFTRNFTLPSRLTPPFPLNSVRQNL